MCNGKCFGGLCFEHVEAGPPPTNYWAFAITDKRIVWAESPLVGGKGTLNSVPKEGGTPTKLADLAEAGSVGIAARAGRVYWAGCEKIARVFSIPEGGGTITFPDPEPPSGCVSGPVFDDYNSAFYWLPNSIERVDVNGNPPEVVVSNENQVRSLVAEGTDLFWIATTGIRTLPSYGSTPPKTITGPVNGPSSITVSGGFIYYASDSSTLARIPLAGGTPDYTKGKGPQQIRAFIRDGNRIFLRGTIGGGYIDTATNAVTSIELTTGFVVGVDETYVYAALPDYGIFRLRKSDLP